MIQDLRATWALLLGILFMMLGNGLQATLLGVRATTEGFPVFTTGIIMSGYFVGVFVGSMLAPLLVKRVGHIRVFAALASLASISVLIHGLYVHAVTWALMRLVTGVCYAGIYVVAESWLNDRANNETRGQLLAIYMVITSLGLGVGQFLLNVGDPLGIDLFILTSIIVSVGLIPILLTVRPAPAFSSTKKMSLLDLYKASPLAVISNGLTAVGHGTIFGLGAVYASNVLYNVDLISLFMACFLFGGLLSQWPIGWLADKINRRIVIILISVTASVACLAAVFLPVGSVPYFAAVVIVGAAAIPMYSLTVAYANDRLEPDQIIAASGSMVMISGIGLSTGPLLVSYLMGEFGSVFFFYGIALTFALIVGFCFYRMGVSDSVTPEDQSPVVTVGVMGTPVAEYNAADAEEYVESLFNNDEAETDKQTKAEASQS